MWGAILASGWGTRLRSWGTIPKPLTPVAGRPVIEYPARTLRAVGVDRVVVVEQPGSGAHEVIRGIFERVVPIHNYRVWLGNAYSLSLALRSLPVGEVVLVVMSDHIIEPGAVAAVHDAAVRSGHHVLGVDTSPKWVDVGEATKVLVDGGRVVAAGKDMRRWDALDIGAAAIVNDGEVAGRAEEAAWAGLGFSQFMASIRAVAADVRGAAWADVDSPEEVAEASVGRLREVVRAWEEAIG